MRALWRRRARVLIACALATYVVSAAPARRAYGVAHVVKAWGGRGPCSWTTGCGPPSLGARSAQGARPGDAAHGRPGHRHSARVGLQTALVRYDGGLSGRFSRAVYVFGRARGGVRPAVAACWSSRGHRARRRASLRDLWRHRHDRLYDARMLRRRVRAADLTLLRAEVPGCARLLAHASRSNSSASRRTRGATACSARRAERARRSAQRSTRARQRREIQPIRTLRARPLAPSLDLHTAVLLWLNDAGTHLRISELSTASEEVRTRPSRRRRRPRAALAQRARVSLEGLKPSFQGAVLHGPLPCGPWRHSGARRRAAAGILGSDRLQNVAFTPTKRRSPRRPRASACERSRTSACSCSSKRAKVEQGNSTAQRSHWARAQREGRRRGGREGSARVASFELAR